MKTNYLAQSGNTVQGEISIPGAAPQATGETTSPNKERIFIHFSQPPTATQLSELAALGVTTYPNSWIPPVGNHPTGFILADMPVDKLDTLAAKNYVAGLDTAEEMAYPQNDQARAAMNVDSVWSGGDTGAGVTIAVLDSGIDTSNPDFPPLNTSNSKDYSNYPTLNDTITNTVTGHGTHVTGSVLGRGVNSAAYKGVAPAASLIFLKIGDDITGDASSNAITYAIRDAVDVYHARIITMSYGGWSQYHDGSDQESQAVDYALSKGAAVFIAAGNDADGGWHYSGTIAANSTSADIPVTLASGTSSLPMNLVWFDGLGTQTNLSLQYYDSSHALLASTSGGQSQSPRGSTEASATMLNTVATAGTYYLRIQNNSTKSQFFHIYSNEDDTTVTFTTPDPNYTLDSPAEADSAIAVGAYVTRTSWTDYRGVPQSHTTATLGSIATFSSRGPRVDGGAPEKPEIVAPGEGIISVRDNTVYPWPTYNTNADIYPYAKFIIDNDGLNLNGSGPADYLLMSGTSMACPLAAGVGALLLSKNPALTPAQVKNALETTATDKGTTGFNNIYGYGLINASAAITANTTLSSYSDAAHTAVCNDFSNSSTQHTAYMYGHGYLSSQSYQVAYYDGSNNKIATDNVTSTDTGTLYSQHAFTLGTDIAGTWHVIVGEPQFSLPGLYDAACPYTIVTGTFTVQASAVVTPGPMIISTVKIGAGGYSPAALGVNATTNRIYVTNIQTNNVSVIDGATNSVVTTVNVGDSPAGLAVNAGTNRIYAANAQSNNVSVIDGATNSVVATVNVGSEPFRLGVNATSNRIYVTNVQSNNVSVIDGATNSVVSTVNVGDGPSGAGVNPTTNRIYVSNDATNNVSVIDGVSNSVITTVNVGSGPGGVEVNPTTNRIYVANYGSNSVSVIDGASNSVIATVNVGASPRGVTVNSITNRIYVANFGSDSVSVIDGTSNGVIATVSVGSEPFGAGVNSTTNRIYATNYGSNNVSVIGGVSNSVVSTINLGSGTDAIGVNSGNGSIYVASSFSNSVSVIDGTSNSVVTTVDVGSEPFGVGVNPTTNRIYVANFGSDSVSVIDGTSNGVIATVNVGSEPFGAGVNSTTNRIYATNYGSNNVSVIDGVSNSVVTTVGVGTVPVGIAVNPSTNRIYVASSFSNSVSVIDGASNSVIATVNVGSEPFGIGVNPSTNRIYVANSFSNSVSVIDGASNSVIATINVGVPPGSVAVNPVTNRIYVANYGSNSVLVVDGASNSVLYTVKVGNGPRGIGVYPGTNRIYVANYLSDTVSVIQDVTPSPSPIAPVPASSNLSIGLMIAGFAGVMVFFALRHRQHAKLQA